MPKNDVVYWTSNSVKCKVSLKEDRHDRVIIDEFLIDRRLWARMNVRTRCRPRHGVGLGVTGHELV